MIYVIFILLTLVVVELGGLIGVVIWRIFDTVAGNQPSGRRLLLTPPLTSEDKRAAEGGPKDTYASENEKKADEAEKRQAEALNSILGYDMSAARKAVRHDAEERDA